MEAAYAGDAERLRAHRAKTVDVGVEAFRAGRASTQAEVLRASGHEIHEKAEGAAERQWLDGRLAEMEWWCKARTRALGRVLRHAHWQLWHARVTRRSTRRRHTRAWPWQRPPRGARAVSLSEAAGSEAAGARAAASRGGTLPESSIAGPRTQCHARTRSDFGRLRAVYSAGPAPG